MVKPLRKMKIVNVREEAKTDDPRFQAMHVDPLFKRSNSRANKLKLDPRFQKVLSKEEFRASHGHIDKYGRKLKKKESVVDELREFYDIDDNNENEATKETSKKGDNTGNHLESRLAYLNKLSRGEISDLESSSDEYDEGEAEGSESDEDEDDSQRLTKKHRIGGPLSIPDDEVIRVKEDDIRNSNRIAVMNCDWAKITAKDIM
jgi:hypothetical protein